jgi:uncharacterized protein DUF4337
MARLWAVAPNRRSEAGNERPWNEAEGSLQVHETRERLEHAEHAHHVERKRAALLIIVLAVALAIVEMAGKEAQFASIAHNILSSDTYNFYQAKTIRETVLRSFVENTEALTAADAPRPPALEKQIAAWKAEIGRLDSDPSTQEGRKELLDRARTLEGQRDEEEQSYHHFEYAAAGLQLAIVIASAAVITEITLLEIISAAIGIVAVSLATLGWLAPSLLRI